MTLSTRQHNAIALIVFCSLLVFFRLNSAPLEPIETLLAFKADLILQFNGLFDLAPYFSGDGTAQFAMPPMGIWFSALAMKIMGNLPLHLRIPSVLCSAASLVLLYQLARRIVGYQLALIAPVLLASTLSWNTLARQSGADIPAMMFVLMSVFCLILFGEEQGKATQRRMLFRTIGLIVLYAISIAGGLLSGYFAGGIAVLLFLPMIPYLRKKGIIAAIIGLIIGIGISGLWYQHIYLSIGGIFSGGIFVSILFHNLISSIIAQPFIVFAFIAPFILVQTNRKSNSLNRNYSSVENTLLIWFGVSILCGGMTRTDFFSDTSAVVLIIPAAVLLSVRGYELVGSSVHQAKIMWVLIICTSIAAACSMSERVRELFFSAFQVSENFFGSIIPVLALVIIIGVGLFLPKLRLYQITSRLTRWFGILIPLLLIVRIAVINISKPHHSSETKPEVSNHINKNLQENQQKLVGNVGNIWREQ
jgi:4-amino-4-deoxy-L-arabinose transferase-like glycosyltransferase